MTYYTNQQIAMFFAVVEHHKLSEAARAMYVSQPSLSKTLSRLENSLGVRLFDRTPEGMKLTKEGEYLYNNFKTNFNQLAVAIDKAREMQLQSESVLRVGIYSSSEATSDYDKAREIIAQYREKYPDVQVYVEYMTLSDLRHHVLAGNLDVAISKSYALKNMLDVEKRRVNRMSWGIAIPESYPAAQDDELDVNKLNSVTLFCLSPEETQVDKPLNLERCIQVGFTPKNIVYMQNAMSIFHAVEHGQGCYMVGHIRRKIPGVRHYDLPELPNTPYVTAVWRTQNRHPELLRFIELLPQAEGDTAQTK